MRGLPLRLRLALAFAAAMAVLLAAASSFLYLRHAEDLSHALDLQLRQRAQDLIPAVSQPSASVDPLAGPALVEQGESFAEVVSQDGSVLDSTSPLGGAALLTPAELGRAQHRAIVPSCWTVHGYQAWTSPPACSPRRLPAAARLQC